MTAPDARHPARTPAQRRILDAIGCGNNSPMMHRATRDAMLRNGLIVLCGQRYEPVAGGFRVTIDVFEMPIPVHMRWCAAMAAECEGEGGDG